MKLIIKRIVDLIFAILGIIVLSPIIVLVSILVKVKLGSPIFFTQDRVGYKGREFKIIKFRTMSNETDDKGEMLTDKKRTTKFGNMLRNTSIDEIPELFNVLIGDMSIVGPRPLLSEYKDYYSEEQFRRHDIRPGITGWAQVNGRNSITWSKTFKLDVWYVDNMNLLLDIKIIFMTIFKVIRRCDTSNKRDAIVKHFNEGSSE